MPGDRLLRIVGLFGAGGDIDAGPARLCEVCAEAVAMTGAGVMLMSGDMPRGSVCSSNEVSALIEELQYTLGEGPCVDAYHQDRPVLEPDLASTSPNASSTAPSTRLRSTPWAPRSARELARSPRSTGCVIFHVNQVLRPLSDLH